MHVHHLLHSSDAKALPFHNSNVHTHNSQSMKLSSQLFSNSGNHWLFSLTADVKNHKLSKTSVEVFIFFTGFQCLESSRSLSLKDSKASKDCTVGNPVSLLCVCSTLQWGLYFEQKSIAPEKRGRQADNRIITHGSQLLHCPGL